LTSDFDNPNNKFLNKYKKILKNRKKMVEINSISNFIQFHCLIVHQRSSKFHTIYNDFNLTVINGLSNDNEIVRNLKHYQL
jgi:hypothetical protein